MGLLTGDKKTSNYSDDDIITTTNNTTRDVGLTGAAAIDLAAVSTRGGVSIAQIGANQNLYMQQAFNEGFAELLRSAGDQRQLATSDYNALLTEGGKQYSQLLGGAGDIIGAGSKLLDYTYDTSSNVLNFVKNETDNAYEYSGDVIESGTQFVQSELSSSRNFFGDQLDATRDYETQSFERSQSFASANVSKITDSALQGAKFVTDTASNIANSVIPQTKSANQIIIGALVLIGVIAFVNRR